MDARKLERLRSALAEFMEELTPDIGRRDRRQWAMTYVRGLLLDGQRKSVEPMAQRLAVIDDAAGDYEQSLQQFVNQSPWDERAVRNRLAGWIRRRLKGESFLLIDSVGFPKQGAHSVGVARLAQEERRCHRYGFSPSGQRIRTPQPSTSSSA